MTVILSVPPSGQAADLRLRPWQLDDLPALVAAHRDPQLRRWLSTSLANEAEARHWLEVQAVGWDAATRFSFAVVAAGGVGSPIGHVVVKVGTSQAAEIGYWTASQARGRGVAARAVETVSQWALDTQDRVRLSRLDLLHAADNRASCRVAMKCGYALHDHLPAAPPLSPTVGHRHVRHPHRAQGAV